MGTPYPISNDASIYIQNSTIRRFLLSTFYAETADLSFIISNPCCCCSPLSSAASCRRRCTKIANTAAAPSNAAPEIIMVDDPDWDDTAENDV